jgi:hypothetical protein
LFQPDFVQVKLIGIGGCDDGQVAGLPPGQKAIPKLGEGIDLAGQAGIGRVGLQCGDAHRPVPCHCGIERVFDHNALRQKDFRKVAAARPVQGKRL